MKINGKEVKEKVKKMKPVFSVNEAQIKGVSQCKNHYWIQISDNEAECRNCPTVITYNPARYKVVNGKLNEQTKSTTSKK